MFLFEVTDRCERYERYQRYRRSATGTVFCCTGATWRSKGLLGTTSKPLGTHKC